MSKQLICAAALSIAATGASANHYMQTADPVVMQQINEIITVLGQGCTMGNAGACNAIPIAQQQAHMMLSAGYDCLTQGNMQACNFYRQNVFQLQQSYDQVAMAYNNGTLFQNTGAAGATMSHAERMQQIHNWGQQRLEFGRQSQALLDNNHAQFMEMLRQ